MSFLVELRRRIESLALRWSLRRIETGGASPRDYVRACALLLRGSELDRAADIVERGLARFPTDDDLLLRQARIAFRRNEYGHAKILWQRIRDRQPDLVEAWKFVSSLQRTHSQLDEASATLAEALKRFPRHPDIVGEAARLHDRRGDYEKSASLWRMLLKRDPGSAEHWRGLTYSLTQAKRLEEAEMVLASALARFPEDRSLMAISGNLAMAREDWDGALAIWQAFRARFPDDVTGWDNLGKTLTYKHLLDIDQGRLVVNDHPVEIARVEDEALRLLLLGFESLGGDCEFGMVQRRYGAEPLGLLRWNYVALESLLAALAARFEDMGDPAQTEFWPGEATEIYIQDRRWGLAMHTFLSSATTDRDALFPKMCKRIAYLRDKLVEDLVAAEKIFVFKIATIAFDDLLALHTGLRRFGPARLLCVVLANTSTSPPFNGAAGEVREVRTGLYLGFIRRLGGDQGFWDIAFDDWIAICRGLRPIEAA